MKKEEAKGSFRFGTETSPSPSILKIQAHNMDIFIMAKKSPQLINPYCDQCGVEQIRLKL